MLRLSAGRNRPVKRPQFTLRALLVAMLVVAAFFGGAAWQRWLSMPVFRQDAFAGGRPGVLKLRDGSTWVQVNLDEDGQLPME